MRSALLSLSSVGILVVTNSVPWVMEAQTAKPTFEVASVKAFRGSAPTIITRPASAWAGGAFDMTGTLVQFVLYAYDLRDYQLVAGGADWVREDRFEIAARAGREVSTAEVRLMLRSLLEERFKLATRWEERQMRQYELVLARSDGQFGPYLKRSDCKTKIEPPPAVPAGAARSSGCGSIALIARGASTRMEASVIDKTGLEGSFEYFLYTAPAERPITVGGRVLPHRVGLWIPASLRIRQPCRNNSASSWKE